MVGYLITKVNVKVDYNNSLDKNFVFTVMTDGTDKDMNETINKALSQKFREGELDGQNLRSIQITSQDERGYFNSILGDINGLLKLI